MAYKKEKDGPKMGKTPTYMKSGFKMKSGSPFQRNFGIGASPMKDRKDSTLRNDRAAHHGADHQHNWDKDTPEEVYAPKKKKEETAPTQMKSPMKKHEPNHGDFSQMSPSWMGDKEAMKELSEMRSRVNKLGELPSMTDEQNEEYQRLRAKVLEMDRQYEESQKGLPMQSPMKNSGEEFARQIKEQDYGGNMPAESFKRIKDNHDKGHAKGNPHA